MHRRLILVNVIRKSLIWFNRYTFKKAEDAMKHHIRAAPFSDQISTRNVNQRIAKLSNAHSSRNLVCFALPTLLMCKAFQHIKPDD